MYDLKEINFFFSKIQLIKIEFTIFSHTEFFIHCTIRSYLRHCGTHMKFFPVKYLSTNLLIKHPNYPSGSRERLYYYSQYSPLPVFLSLVVLSIVGRVYFPISLMQDWLCYLLQSVEYQQTCVSCNFTFLFYFLFFFSLLAVFSIGLPLNELILCSALYKLLLIF